MILIDQLTTGNSDARSLLRDSRVLRFHKDVYDMAIELVAKDSGQIAKIAPFICWPDYDIWIEVDTGGAKRFGFLYQADRDHDVTKGRGMLVVDDRRGEEPLWLPVHYDLASYTMRHLDTRSVMQEQLIHHPEARRMLTQRELSDIARTSDPLLDSLRVTPLLTAFKPILFAMLALINSPKIITQRLVSQDKLNKTRLRKGKYPFHPYHEIRLNVDNMRINITRGLGDGPQREQHFVRAHPRFFYHPRYKNVSVIMIPPHYRGNPELGMRNTTYRADRKQSKWKR